MKRMRSALAALTVILGTVQDSSAGPISVSYTVSGSSGNYDLDFSVTNNMNAWPTQAVYFFGVRLSGHDITGSPSAWFDNGADSNWFNNGGSNTEYNNPWRNGSGGVANATGGMIFPGETLSGFIVHDPDLIAPISVPWFAVAFSNTFAEPYTGGGNFNPDLNPGFEGLAQPADVANTPAPSTLVMSSILLGMCGIGWTIRRQQATEAMKQDHAQEGHIAQ
jgi:hypothetical protein